MGIQITEINTDYEKFSKLITKIVKAGATPVIVCKCSRKSWFYEGSTGYLFNRFFITPCQVCQSNEKLLLGDFDAPEL